MECSRCGASRVKLFDVVSHEGIVRLCRECVSKDNLPIVKKPLEHEFKEINKKQSVYQRLANLSGFGFGRAKKNEVLEEQNKELKKLAEKNYSSNLIDGKVGDLIDNFHWVVMRHRRMKKLTQAQFAVSIGETEIAIKNLEKGKLPTNYSQLIRKVEDALRINLFSGERKSFDEEVREIKESVLEKGEITLDNSTMRTLTISDLKEVKREKEKRFFRELEKSLRRRQEILSEDVTFEETTGYKPNEVKENLSQEEIDRIIFGR